MISMAPWFGRQAGIYLILMVLVSTIYTFPQESDYPGHQQRAIRTQKVRTCGRKLMNLIQLVCSGTAASKRGSFSQTWTIREMRPWSSDLAPPAEDGEVESDDFMDTRSALSLFGSSKRSISNTEDDSRFFRSLRGAHDECCKKSCSMDILRTYCRPGR